MSIEVFDDMNMATAEEVARMLPLVSAQRREQALRYKHLCGQFCCLKSWLMVKEAIEKLKIKNYELKITNYELGIRNYEWAYDEYGKPSIQGAPCFSISHCKEGVAVAVDDEPVGVDIEGIRHADDTLIERVMSEKELRECDAHDCLERDRWFTRLWTRKEAVLKCKGTGIEGFEALQRAIEEFEGKVITYETEKYIISVATHGDSAPKLHTCCIRDTYVTHTT